VRFYNDEERMHLKMVRFRETLQQYTGDANHRVEQENFASQLVKL
jgi:hypothetical protein